LEEFMISKKLIILSVILLIALVSISCSLFTLGDSSLKFEPDVLPNSQAGVAYEAEIRITQNRTPAGDIYISKGALPAGLKLIKVEGEDIAKISGKPEETGTFTFTISVWCYGTNVSGQTGEKEYSITVEE
jgi:hypothetical protein